MRIAFDHQAFCRQIAGGISRYFCRLAEALAQKQQTVGIFAPVYRNIYLQTLPAQYVHGISIKNYPPKTANLCVAANGFIARPMIGKWMPDIVHETYFMRQSMAPANCPSVITVFDMIGELDALQNVNSSINFEQTDKYQAIQRADHVICISEHTRQDLLRLFKIPESKVSVAHLGCDFADRSLNKEESRKNQSTNQPKPFLLYVGLREGYKNFQGMLKAVAASPQLMDAFDLIAFGGGSFTPAEQTLMHKLGFRAQQVRQMSGNDQDLAFLYQQATAFIYPSLCEGFGLPPLEAMAMSCPVVSSNTSSMPEVIGDAAEYFDPVQPNSMMYAIEQVVFSETRTQNLILKGKKRVGQFTWAQCAEKTLSIYQTVIATKR